MPLDLSGVDMLDSHLTYRIRTLAVAARLMGVDTVVCGMRPAVVMTIVEMGLDLSPPGSGGPVIAEIAGDRSPAARPARAATSLD